MQFGYFATENIQRMQDAGVDIMHDMGSYGLCWCRKNRLQLCLKNKHFLKESGVS